MDDRLRGFDGEIYTLNVGPEKKVLRVPECMLSTVPYFKTALSSGSFTESKAKTFDLPDDDPKAVADVLYYAYTGHVETLRVGAYIMQHIDDRLDRKPRNDACKQMADAQAYLQAYITADKWKAEATVNKLVDAFITYQSKSAADPGYLAVLGRAEYRDCPLYKLLMQELVFEMLSLDCRDRLVLFNAADEQYISFEEACRSLPHEDLIQMALTTSRFNRFNLFDANDNENGSPTLDDIARARYPSMIALKQICKYHKHDLTERCSKPTEENED